MPSPVSRAIERSTVVPLYSRPRKFGDDWTFHGNAFFINSTHLLTARHVIDGPGFYALNEEGSLVFNGQDDESKWAIGLDPKKSNGTSVEVVLRPSDSTLDVAVLKLSVEVSYAIEPVVWIQQMSRTEWLARKEEGLNFVFRGCRPTSNSLATRLPVHLKPQPLALTIDGDRYGPEDIGLVSGRIKFGGLRGGDSGGPVFLETEWGPYCVGLGVMGGENFPLSLFVGEGVILPLLADGENPIAFRSTPFSRLPPKGISSYLFQLREETRKLLVPLLGAPKHGQPFRLVGETVREWSSDLSEERFIRLFICLHAHFGILHGNFPRREGEVERVYNHVREIWTRAPLLEFAAAILSPKSDSGLMLEVVRQSIEHCISAERLNVEPTTSGLNPWQTIWKREICRDLRDQTEKGERRLANIPNLWVGLQSASRVVLVGPAGGGKSTVAQFVALALTLPPSRSHHPKLLDLLRSDYGIHGRLPIFRRLRDWKDLPFTAKSDAERAAIVNALIEGSDSTSVTDIIHRYLKDGMAFLIFDGLDELGADQAKRFSQCLVAWLKTVHKENRVLVTSRPTAYPPADPDILNPGWELRGFQVLRLLPLDSVQQREFLEVWFASHTDAADGDQTAHRLAKEVFGRILDSGLQDMSQDPLLLSGLAELAQSQVDKGVLVALPGNRASIFNEVIDLMLARWEAVRLKSEHSRLEKELADLHLDIPTIRSLLARLALASLQKFGKGDFSRHSLESELVRQIQVRPNPPTDPKSSAERLVDLLGQQSGLIRLLEDGPLHKRISLFEFPVRSYRNFLAGEALFQFRPPMERGSMAAVSAFDDGPAAFAVYCVEHGLAAILGCKSEEIDSIHSQQALELALQFQISVKRYPLSDFLEYFRRRIVSLQASGQSAFRLIRSAVRLAMKTREWQIESKIGPVRITSRNSADLSIWRPLALQAMQSPAELRKDRISAGTLYGLLSPPLDTTGSPAIRWCRVGSEGNLRFLQGDEREWGGGGAFQRDLVRKPFYVSAVPVTVDDYHCFTQATGANRPMLFEGLARDWETPVFQTPNHPVVGVSWKDAKSYCDWLTKELHAGRLCPPKEEVRFNPKSWEIRLPEEWEWEFAARGTIENEASDLTDKCDLLRVPWGWASDAEVFERSNCAGQFQGTTPVQPYFRERGILANCSLFEIFDLVGNVWEWCQTPYVEVEMGIYPLDYESNVQNRRNEAGVRRVVRGGSWDNNPEDCRCARRRGPFPEHMYRNLGFRLVLAPVLPGAAEQSDF